MASQTAADEIPHVSRTGRCPRRSISRPSGGALIPTAIAYAPVVSPVAAKDMPMWRAVRASSRPMALEGSRPISDEARMGATCGRRRMASEELIGRRPCHPAGPDAGRPAAPRNPARRTGARRRHRARSTGPRATTGYGVGMASLQGALGPHPVHRVGFGAMQLPGPGVMGPPRDHDQAIAVIRRARELGVDHIDTASYYGPHVANELLAEALDPWPADLRIVSKVGAQRDEAGAWLAAITPDDIRAQVEDDLRVLGIDRLTAVNLRVLDTTDEVFDTALGGLIALRDEGLVELIGLSNVDVRHLERALERTEIACVQNQYGLLDRGGEAVLEATAERGIAFVPFFPLGSAFGVAPRPADDPQVQAVAAEIGATASQVALAWLLHHGEHVLLIPGTSSLDHLEENLGAATVELSPEQVTLLDGLAG
jgi:pyridoxine 4-dehydrogenase